MKNHNFFSNFKGFSKICGAPGPLVSALTMGPKFIGFFFPLKLSYLTFFSSSIAAVLTMPAHFNQDLEPNLLCVKPDASGMDCTYAVP